MYETMPTTLAIVVAIGLILTGLGVAVAWVGRRARRVGDHPHCRRCGFDLVGQPATSDRCPECGADVTAPRAIITGRRAARPAWVVGGALFAALALLVTASVSAALFRSVDWASYKPVWWLLRETHSTNRATRDAALDSLTRHGRFEPATYYPRAPRLDEADETRVIARLLEVQADATLPWRREWGDPIARRIADGTLPADQRDAFLRATLAPATLQLRVDIRAGDPLPMRLTLGSDRGADDGGLVVALGDPDEAALVDGTFVLEPDPNDGGGTTHSLGNATYGASRQLEARRLAGVGPGPHVVEFRSVARIRDGHGDAAREVAAYPVSATATVTIHPADAQLIEWVDDVSMRPAIAAGLAKCEIRLRPGSGSFPGSGSLSVDASNVTLPMPVAFAIIIRQDGRSWPVGTLATATGRISSSYGVRLDGLKPGRADVVFTSDASAAAGSIDVVRAWHGEVVVRDVPVTTRP